MFMNTQRNMIIRHVFLIAKYTQDKLYPPMVPPLVAYNSHLLDSAK